MNMISTGAFQTETDASIKQLTLAEKFAAVWEKKNSKTARAGGVSLMALSLAACGSDDATTTATTTTTTTTTDTTTTTVDAAQTVALTMSSITGAVDNVSGGSGDDSFIASASGMLTTGDVVDGAAGSDTLTSRHTVTAAVTIAPTVSNVETHNFRIDHDGATADAVLYDMTDISGATNVNLYKANSSGATADSVVTFSGTGMTTGVNVGIIGGDTGADNSAVDLTVTYQAVTGTADAATMTLNGAAANVVTVAGIETLTLSALNTELSASATGASDINSLQAANASSIVITGAGGVTLGGSGGTFVALNGAATLSVDASANTGGVSFVSEANALTFTGGTGADKVYMTNTLTTADSLTGGDGHDTVGLTADVTATVGGVIVGFEDIDFVDSGTATYDLDDYANSTITHLSMSGALAGDNLVTANDAADGIIIELGGGEALTAGDDMTVTIKNASAAGSNNDTLNVHTVGTAAVDFGTLTAAGIETINIVAGGAVAGNSIAVLTAAAADTLVVTGTSALEITAFTSSATITDYDTTGMTGAFVMGAAGQSTAATLFDGGAGADTFVGNSADDVLKAGAGTTNSLTGGAGDDAYTCGSGVDTIVQAAHGAGTVASATTITASAAIAIGHTITFGNGVDVVTGFTAGIGGDVLDHTDGASTALATALGKTEDALTDDSLYFLSGSFTSSTGKFTITADGAGADTIIIQADNGTNAASSDIMENDSIIVLVGVDSDDLVDASNFT
jgi:S-layer protein